MLKPASEITKKIEFSFDNNGKSLKSEMNINCNNTYNQQNCIFLAAQKVYKVKLSLELMRNQAYQNDKYRNFEVQIKLLGLTKSEDWAKVVFIERYDYLIELIYDVFYFPFRLFGFMNHHDMLISFREDLDNSKFNLDKIEILIKDHLINVKRATFILIPYVGWISFFFGLCRIFILPMTFFVSVLVQITSYIGIKFILDHFVFSYDEDQALPQINENTITNNNTLTITNRSNRSNSINYNEFIENALSKSSLVAHANAGSNTPSINTFDINNSLLSGLSFTKT